MTNIGRRPGSLAVSITGVVTAHERCAQLAVLRVHRGNVGVFARAGLVHRCRAVGAWRAELGGGAVEVGYERGEGSVGRHAAATARRGYMAMQSRV